MTSHSDQQHLLLAYEALLECSEQMLVAARAAEWERLIDLQGDYLARVEMLQQLDAMVPELDDSGLKRKARLLERLLEQDGEIRQRLLDRRQELSEMILGSRQKQALSRTYSYYQQASEVIEAAQRFTST